MTARQARGLLLTLPALALALAVAPAGAGAATSAPAITKSTKPGGDWVRSYGGWTVFTVTRGGLSVLAARHAGVTRRVPGPPRKVTQVPGLGAGPAGTPALVYQGCTGRTCTLYLVNLAQNTQRPLTWLGHPRRGDEDVTESPETYPTIWGDRVAFQTRARGGGVRLLAGPASRAGATTTLRHPPLDGGASAYGLALGPRHLGILWDDPNGSGNGATAVYVTALSGRGRPRVLDEGVYADQCSSFVYGLRFTGQAFTWRKDAGASAGVGFRAAAGAALRGSGCKTVRGRHYRYDPQTGRVTPSTG